LQLTGEEQAMLRGESGETVREALALQLEVGRFYGAQRFVVVTNVHMMGDIEVMGDSGLAHLRRLAHAGARCEVPITTNARCFDFAHVERLGQDGGEAEKEKQLIAYLRDMNVITSDTCINYQTLYQPHFGEHVAWGDTGTVIWANSVCGARSNFESGPAAMAAAMTRRTPEYGFHLDGHRKGTFVVELDTEIGDFAEWGRSERSSASRIRATSKCRCSPAWRERPPPMSSSTSALRLQATARWRCITWSA
jgi:predicted aconitase